MLVENLQLDFIQKLIEFTIVLCLILLGLIPSTTSFEFVVDAIEFNIIGFLLGMMIIVAILAESGVFQWVV